MLAFFSERETEFSTFARAHNLAIDKYYHESPSWSFRFQHPGGGAAAVELLRVDDLTIIVKGSWYIDDYDTFTRYLKWGPGRDFTVAETESSRALEACLNEVVSWNRNDLTPHTGYKKYWSIYTKEDWNKLHSTANLPMLRM